MYRINQLEAQLNSIELKGERETFIAVCLIFCFAVASITGYFYIVKTNEKKAEKEAIENTTSKIQSIN